jgi:tetratricopeptide (TPR) repeat protein
MIIDNIIVIFVAIILITYLSVNYVKKYAPVNLFVIGLCAFSLGIYLPVVYYNVYLRMRYQIPLGLGIFVLPCIFAILQYNNINFSKNLLYKKAENYYKTQKYTKCINTLQKLISKEGRKTEAIFLIAKCFYELKEYRQAKEYIYEVVEKDIENYQAYFILGNILENENDIDSAIDMYEKCLEIEPSYYDAYEVLGILLADQGKYEKAEELYKKAIGYHAESYELLYNLAMIQLELGKTEEAEKNLEFALVIKPDINEAIYSLGNIKLLKGNYNEALSLYNEITKTENYGLKAYYKIAIIYVTKNEFEKAMGIIEYLINEDSKYIDLIENEFIFNAMRSKIDHFLKNRKETENVKNIQEQEEIDALRKERKNWFGRNKYETSDESSENNTILYDDIDITRTGFREEDKK